MRDPRTMVTDGWSCHSCGSLNPAADEACRRCGASAAGHSEPPSSARPPAWREGATVEARYEIVRMIGQGAMGQVFEARDNDVGRWVALKRLNEELIHSPRARQRFVREARALGRVDHDNVIRIHDTFEDARGVPVLGLEFVGGGTLADRIPRSGLGAGAALSIADALLSGLEAIHDAGLVHRDIKPSNILMGNDDTPKIADLGIAHDAGGKSLTRTGTRLGTARYMSPEQIRGEAVSSQTDIYAFGIMLYEMLCGRVPFDAANEYDVQELQVRDKPKMKRLRKKVPTKIVKTIGRALEKAPQDRWPSAADLRRALKLTAPGAPFDERSPDIASEVAARATAEPAPSHARRTRKKSGQATPSRPDAMSSAAWVVAGIATLVGVGFMMSGDDDGESSPVRADPHTPAPKLAPEPRTIEVPVPNPVLVPNPVPVPVPVPDPDPALDPDPEPPSRTTAVVALRCKKQFNNTSLREKPHSKSDPLATIYVGLTVELLDETAPDTEFNPRFRWYRVRALGKVGWLHQNSLEEYHADTSIFPCR